MRFPDPALVKAPVPEMTPEKVVLAAVEELRVADPNVMLPAPEIEPTVSLLLAKAKVAPLDTLRLELSAMTPAAPNVIVPALTVVVPV